MGRSTFIIVSQIFILFFFLFSHSISNAQCAGNDNIVTICNKDSNSAFQNYDLFAQLGGSPITGGVWVTQNPAIFFAITDADAGIVDLWRINNHGTHVFTYINPNCSESANVTINLGGYPGEDNIDGSANACSDNSNVNLFGFLGSPDPDKIPDFNGLWEEVPGPNGTGFLRDGNFFDAQLAGPGVYELTYSVPSVDSCLPRQSRVILEVHPNANPGIPNDFIICTTDDFSTLTNFDLDTLLAGEDVNGTWAEFGTNQLNSLSDSFINIEELNNTGGHGTYRFEYTVFPTHPVCEQMSSEVNIIILPVFDGTITAQNYCVGSDYSVDIAYDSTIMPNGNYEIEYTVNGTNGISGASLSGGNGSFNIDPAIVSQNQFSTLQITGISGTAPIRDICPTINISSTNFIVSNPLASISDTCETENILVSLSNILNPSGSPSNDSYDINYSIIASDGTITNSSINNVAFTNGNANFNINTNQLLAPGTHDISISTSGSLAIACNINTSFTIIPSPSTIDLDLLIDDSCDATVIDVFVNAPVLNDGTYTITYDVTELNSSNVLTTNTVNFTGGTANYQIDVASLPQGNYVANVRSTQNDTTPCRTIFDFEVTENFARNGIPSTPQADDTQLFCLSDYQNTAPTLMDISVTATGDIFFYATDTDTNILSITTVLENGEDYYISNTDPNNNCEGSARIRVETILSNPETPTSTTSTPVLCGPENPTLADLEVNLDSANSVVWFTNATGGNSLEASTLLVNGQSYFAATQTPQQCLSTVRLEFTPIVTIVPAASLLVSELALCGIDNPTVAALFDLENNPGFEIDWYNQEKGGTPLAEDFLLTDGVTYYAQTRDTATGCVNSERVSVTIDLSNCIPEEYNFFIPDGFSPNADGRNDTFFIPNIAVIFPDFTLEILNRYGNSLFKGDINNPAWDGSNGNSIAPNGVYFYIINFNKDDLKPKQGRLYLNQ